MQKGFLQKGKKWGKKLLQNCQSKQNVFQFKRNQTGKAVNKTIEALLPKKVPFFIVAVPTLENIHTCQICKKMHTKIV